MSGVKTLRGQTLTANNITVCQSTGGDTNCDDDIVDYGHYDDKICFNQGRHETHKPGKLQKGFVCVVIFCSPEIVSVCVLFNFDLDMPCSGGDH